MEKGSLSKHCTNFSCYYPNNLLFSLSLFLLLHIQQTEITSNSHPNLDYDDDMTDDKGQILFKPDNSLETQHIRTLLYKLAKKYLKNGEWRKLAFHWGFTDSQVLNLNFNWTDQKTY